MQKNSSVGFSLVLMFTAYFLSAFFKISASIVLPVFQKQLNLSSAMVGFLSSTFFIPYAMGQLFSGALCMKYGSHKVMAVGCLTAAVGTMFSAFATLPVHIALSRFCMGLGVGPSFVVVIDMVRENFSGEKFAKISGLGIMVCNLGGAFGSAPLKYFLDLLGIKLLFVILTIIQVCMAFGLLFAERNYEKSESLSENSGTVKQLVNGIKTLARTPALVAAAMFWASYNLFLAIYQGLWCGEWTISVFSNFGNAGLFSGIAIANGIVVSCIFADDLRIKGQTRQKTVIMNAWLQFATVVLLIVVKNMGHSEVAFSAVLLVDFLYGFTVGMFCVELTAFIKEHTSSSQNSVITGITASIPNICAQGGQWVSGVLIDFFLLKHTLQNSFTFTFAILAAAFCFILVCGTKILMRNFQ